MFFFLKSAKNNIHTNKIKIENFARGTHIFGGLERPALRREVRESDAEASSKLEWGEGVVGRGFGGVREGVGGPPWGTHPALEQWPGAAGAHPTQNRS